MGLKLSRAWLRFAPILVVAACASGSGTSETTPAASTTPSTGGTDLAIVEVIHNDPGTTSTLTIMIEPTAGIRAALGQIEPGQTKRFNYNATPGNYRLMAQGGSSSNSFRLSNREIVTWDMQRNRAVPRNK